MVGAAVTLVLVGLVAFDLLMAFLTWRLYFDFSAQARGEAEAWAAAGGIQIGPVTASAVAARNVTPRAELLLFGRCLGKLPSEQTQEQADPSEDATLEQAKAALARGRRVAGVVDRRLGWVPVLNFVLEERSRVRLDSLDLNLAYSFRDVILTGKLLAVLSVLSGLLPPPVSIRHSPSWDWEDRLSASVAGRICIRPGRLLVDGLWFVVRNIRVWPRAPLGPQEG